MSKTCPYAYIRGKITPIAKATIPIQAKAVQYGIGIYTGLRATWNPDHKQLYVFRLRDHYKRLKNSAKITGMRFTPTFAQFQKLIIDLIKKNRIKENIYIRVTLYCGSTKIVPQFMPEEDDLAIYIISLENYFTADTVLKLMVSDRVRFDDDMISTKAKLTGAYVAGAAGKTDAVKKGFNDAIFLNRDGTVSETSGANIFGYKNGKLITPPLTANNLEGITRRTLLEIIPKELGIPAIEKNFRRTDIHKFDEMFLCGTAAKITSIGSVDRRKIGKSAPGEITKKLQTILTDITLGKIPRYKKFLTGVY